MIPNLKQAPDKMKTALITGVGGQDGSYLTDLLLTKGYRVCGIERRKALAIQRNENLKDALKSDRFEVIDADLLEQNRINEVIRDLQPEEVYNLAAQSLVPYSWTNPIYTCNVNCLGLLHVLEAIRVYSPQSKFYQATSSEIFGMAPETPQKETTCHYPRSPYAVSKSFGMNMARNYRESYGMFACNGILFNHESERRGLDFITRKITYAIAEMEHDLREKLIVGNLDSRRDWGYAPEYVKAMWMMLQHNEPDDYVIATGENHSVKEFIELAFKSVGKEVLWKGAGVRQKGFDKDTNKMLVEISEKFFRRADVKALKGDASKARKVLGWRPIITFDQMVEKMMKHDLEQVKKNL
jgi:GDPmannose 4,6-dehydratase